MKVDKMSIPIAGKTGMVEV